MEFYLGNRVSNPYNSDMGSKVVYRYYFLIINTYNISLHLYNLIFFFHEKYCKSIKAF